MNTYEKPKPSDAYRPTPLAGSVVSYPSRCALWGDARYHGNCDGRLFKSLVERYGAKSVADPMMGSGTTRDVIAGMNRHCNSQIRYWGSDLHQGFNLLQDEIPGRFDFVWLHPPYWSIVRYSENRADLSACVNYDAFVRRLSTCLKRCHAVVSPSGHLAVLIGDVRQRGRYFPIVREILNLDGTIGDLCSIIIKAQHNCRSDAKQYGFIDGVRILHEYCVVFRKGQPSNGRADS